MTAAKTETLNLAAKLVKVMGSISHIRKAGNNTAQNYKYATDADVSDAVRDKLVEQNVLLLTSVENVTTTPFTTSKGNNSFLVDADCQFTFIDGDTGETLSFRGAGSGSDSGDKGIYKAITGAVKYALLKSFLVPTGDDPEKDQDQPQRSSERPYRQRADPFGEMNDPRAVPVQPKIVGQGGNETRRPTGKAATPAQLRKVFAEGQKVGLDGDQLRAFTLLVTGKSNSGDLVAEDVDKLLYTLANDPTMVGAAKEVKSVAAA